MSRKFYLHELNLEFITHLVLSCSKFLSIGEIVDSDSKEDVEKSVVTEEREDDEVEGIDHAVTDPSLGHDPVVHDLVPVLPRQDLEDGEEGDDEGVEVGVRCSLGEIKGAAEELHSEQSKDENEEKEEEKEGEDGAHGVEEGDDKVPQG